MNRTIRSYTEVFHTPSGLRIMQGYSDFIQPALVPVNTLEVQFRVYCSHQMTPVKVNSCPLAPLHEKVVASPSLQRRFIH